MDTGDDDSIIVTMIVNEKPRHRNQHLNTQFPKLFPLPHNNNKPWSVLRLEPFLGGSVEG